jgi:hypothetical protein
MFAPEDLKALSNQSGLDIEVVRSVVAEVLQDKLAKGTSGLSRKEAIEDIVTGIAFLMDEKYPAPPVSEKVLEISEARDMDRVL